MAIAMLLVAHWMYFMAGLLLCCSSHTTSPDLLAKDEGLPEFTEVVDLMVDTDETLSEHLA